MSGFESNQERDLRAPVVASKRRASARDRASWSCRTLPVLTAGQWLRSLLLILAVLAYADAWSLKTFLFQSATPSENFRADGAAPVTALRAAARASVESHDPLSNR
jgi:hypothetical protein